MRHVGKKRQRNADTLVSAWAEASICVVSYCVAFGEQTACGEFEHQVRMAQAARAVQARLGPLVSRAQATLEPAYNWTEKQAVTNYDRIMKNNQQYIVKDKAQADKLWRQLVFTNLARCTPNTPYTIRIVLYCPNCLSHSRLCKPSQPPKRHAHRLVHSRQLDSADRLKVGRCLQDTRRHSAKRQGTRCCPAEVLPCV